MYSCINNLNHTNLLYVIKSDGTRVPFDHNKVRRTCLRAGASRELADTIVNRISTQIHQGIRTSTTYKMVLKALASEETGCIVKHRYRLKESIMRMEPAGSQFEEYVARLLESCGYQINSLRTEIGERCVKHVDISAYSKADKKRYMIECKYHNLSGVYRHQGIAIYPCKVFGPCFAL